MPDDPLAAVVSGAAVLPYGATWTVTRDPIRVQVAVYHAFGVTLLVELANTWPPSPRTRQDG